MFGTFKRPIGAVADVKELEYIAALHQTSSVLHTDGTVSAEDVLYFLRSRFGIDITSDDALDIVKGLSGTARLPLPRVEKKVWRLKEKTNATNDNDSHGNNRKRLRMKRPRCFKSADNDGQEDELAKLEAQLQNLKENKTDTRLGWEFLAMQRRVNREVPKNVTSLVRYDMCQMMSMLLIPSLLRIERYRFKAQKDAPPPRAPLFAGHLNTFSLLWISSTVAHKIIKAPVILIQKARHNRLSILKDSLRPKPDTIILDVLRIMLGSLEDRDSPMTKLRDFAAQANSSATTKSTTATGKARYFPELKETIVTKGLIRRLLENCQQDEASRDDDLIEQMVEAVGGEGTILDERAFSRALVSDVSRWPLECEDDVTTTFFDVYGFGNVECNDYAKEITPEDLLAAPSRDEKWTQNLAAAIDDLSVKSSNSSFHSAGSDIRDIENSIKNDIAEIYESTVAKDTRDSLTPVVVGTTDSSKTSGYDSQQAGNGSVDVNGSKPLRMGKIPEFEPTAGYIDYACDSFSSMNLVVFLFGFFLTLSGLVMSLVTYAGVGNNLNCSKSSFGCTLVETIVNWGVLALVLCVCGILVIMPISLINQSYLSSFRQAIFVLGLLLLYLIVPLFEIFLVDYVGINVSQEYLGWRDDITNRVLFYSFYVFGVLTFLSTMRSFGALLVPKSLARRFAILRLLLVPNDILRSTNTKRAATYKLNSVLDRAYQIQTKSHKHTKARNADHETMLSFLLYGDKTAESGGLLWALKNFSYLNKREGVWLHARLAIGQVLQIMVLVVFTLLWWNVTKHAAESSESKRDEIKEQSWGVGAEWGLYFVPEGWMIYYSCIPAGIVCISVLVLLILITYPNTASLVLKFRSGFLPSLHDPQFSKFRKSSVYIYYNTGNMLYASIGMSGFFFVMVAGLLFLLFWPPTSEFMTLLVAWGLGLGITVGLKMFLTMLCGKNFWKGLYRRRPASANVSSLAYECWHLGLGGGVMISRLCQFLLAAAFWIGRIDSQFLSDEVEVFGYHFDTVPQKFFTEILVHEAHRHPFIERLSAMYLMRLKHGQYFGTDAGAHWRILFTLTLMPWLVKFSQARKHGMDDESDSDANANDSNDDWQLPGPDSFSNSSVKLTGDAPRIRDGDEDSFSSVANDYSRKDISTTNMDRLTQTSKRNVTWKTSDREKRMPSINGDRFERVSSLDLFASARSFVDD